MMKCEDARLLMNVAIDGELEANDLTRLNDHLEHCEHCTVEYEELKYLKELLGEIEMKELPLNFETELHTLLVEESLKEKPKAEKKSLAGKTRKLFRGHLNYVIAAAAMLVIVFVGSQRPFLNLNGGFSKESMSTLNYDMAEETTADYGAEATAAAPQEAAGARSFMNSAPPMVEDQAMESESVNLKMAESQLDDSTLYRTGRLIVNTGNISLQVVNYDEVMEKISEQVQAWDGYIENENTSVKGYYDARNLKYGYMTIRIPSEQFNTMMTQLAQYGNVTNTDVHAEDITKNYRNAAQDIENLKITESRLQEILANATDVQDVLSIENELTRIRGQINNYQRQIKDWEILVDLSSIQIQLDEVTSLEPVIEPIDDSLLGKARAGFIENINSMRRAVESIIIWIISNSPMLILIGVLAAITSWLYKKNKKK